LVVLAVVDLPRFVSNSLTSIIFTHLWLKGETKFDCFSARQKPVYLTHLLDSQSS
jgi:hypothetical protein